MPVDIMNLSRNKFKRETQMFADRHATYAAEKWRQWQYKLICFVATNQFADETTESDFR
jgi:hypothetical protein